MKNRLLLILAGVAFVGSHALPSFDDASGFACLQYCWGVMLDGPGDHFGGWLYYSAFVLTNILFVALLTLGFRHDKWHRTRVVLSGIAFLHVLSWLALNLDASDFRILSIGYFVWLVAYALLFLTLVLKPREKST